MKDFKMKHKFIIVLILICFAIPFGYQWFQTWRDKGFESSGREFIKTCSLNLAAYKDSYGTYVTDSQTIKNCSDFFPAGYVLYYSKDGIPSEYLKSLPELSLPYLDKNSYKLLLAVKHRYHDEIFFWTVDQRNDPELLSVRIREMRL